MTSKMTIGKKLFLSFGAALVLTLVVSLVALQSLGSLGAMLDRVMNKTARKQYLACSIDTGEADVVAAERGVLLRALTKEQTLMERNNRDFGQALESMKNQASSSCP